jgi:hypothetical protein
MPSIRLGVKWYIGPIIIASIKMDRLSINETMHCAITNLLIFLLVTCTRGA